MKHTCKRIAGGSLIATGVAVALLSAASAAGLHPGKILYSFSGGYTNGPDGAFPTGDLIADAAGIYYGTTSGGGGSLNCSAGCGTVYKIEDGVESVIYAFTGGSDGQYPAGGLLLDNEGNLYGSAAGGPLGFGIVYKIAPDGTKTIVYSFTGAPNDGNGPNGDLLFDSEGNLYGTTAAGGNGNCDSGCGTVFKITPEGQGSILYAFQGGGVGTDDDGAFPAAGLTPDGQGNFYGSTYGGGKLAPCPGGCGTIFKITPDGQKSLIYNFEGGQKGGHPSDRLLLAPDSYLYAVCPRGGDSFKPFGCILKVGLDGSARLFYSFEHHADGLSPSAGLIADSEGNLYGTVMLGGAHTSGLVYGLTPHGKFTVLYDFPGSFDHFPTGRLIMDQHGNLVGTTSRGGDHDAGSVFEVKN